ncbi:alkaline-phosphatase-like protein [Pelagophyceae sp. CCMP2097]|nr:alkaline-phosphatase-like protein [Pelagophyceae sp. CCMP2097]|mmetsp:Transcript_19841/g.68372  ORF Transcript_19841/g.68372 Transcript_19841/m.68372 type:complete len:601 (-) Transcript_19841:14-1816(-)
MLALLLALRWARGAGARPNIVLIMSDDLRAEDLGCYGGARGLTPNIDALAERGAVFEAAYAQGTTCAPSRRSMMWGRYPGSLTKGDTRKWPTLGAYLKGAGYWTGRVGKIFHMKVPADIVAGADGVDDVASWSQRFNSKGLEDRTPGAFECAADRARALLAGGSLLAVEDLPEGLRGKNGCGVFTVIRCEPAHVPDQADFKTASKTLDLLKERRSRPNQPFFLGVGFVRPHYPYVNGGFADGWSDFEALKNTRPSRNASDAVPHLARAELSSNKLLEAPYGRRPDDAGDYSTAADFLARRTQSAYYDNVKFLDVQLGRVTAGIFSGHAEETLVLFTSDHGVFLGEYGFWQKHNLHEPVAHVPLIAAATPGSHLAAKFKGLAAGNRVRHPFALVDIYATLAKVASLVKPAHVAGIDMTSTFEERESSLAPRSSTLSFVYEAHGHGLLVRSPGWAYMAYRDMSIPKQQSPRFEEELYDMAADPHQRNNLAATDKNTDASGSQRRCDESASPQRLVPALGGTPSSRRYTWRRSRARRRRWTARASASARRCGATRRFSSTRPTGRGTAAAARCCTEANVYLRTRGGSGCREGHRRCRCASEGR